jgi:hypothetical protein
MKKHILSLIAIIAVFSACKKDAVNTGKNNKGTTAVTFNLGFTQTTGAFSVLHKSGKIGSNALASVDPTLAANSSILYIAIYPSDGSRLFLTKQLSTDTVYGKAQYNLPPGTYTVVFAAGQSDFFYTGTNLSNDAITYSTPLPNDNFDNSWKDTFFKKITLTVGSSPVNQSVSLDRIDSEVIVDIEDAIPADVKFMALSATDQLAVTETSGPAYEVSTGTVEGDPELIVLHSSLTTPVTTGVKNTQFSFITLNSNRPYRIFLYATDALPSSPNNYTSGAQGQQIGYAEIDSVMVVPGHQTILSGNLFGGNGLTNTGGFQVSVNPVWNPTVTTIPFQ